MSDDTERSVASAGSVGEVLAKGIADIIRIATEPEWIPVSERLPKEGQRVLAYEKPDLIVVAEMHSRMPLTPSPNPDPGLVRESSCPWWGWKGFSDEEATQCRADRRLASAG